MRYLFRGVLLLVFLMWIGVANHKSHFSSDFWKAGSRGERADMVSDLDQHVLEEGMTTAQCRALLGEPEYRMGEWRYSILSLGDERPSRPVELWLHDSGSVRLHYESDDWPGKKIVPPEFSSEQTEQLRASVSDRGVERWCANEPGTRSELAEAMRLAVKRGWLTDAELSGLKDCADSSKESWVYEIGSTWLVFDQTLFLRLEDGQLRSWRLLTRMD